MWLSIQDYLKKINSWLSYFDIVSICATFLLLTLFAGYIWQNEVRNRSKVIYRVSPSSSMATKSISANYASDDRRPFGSKKGKTYTFSWCSGSGNIKSANKIYFVNEDSAKQTGRTLSKLCKR